MLNNKNIELINWVPYIIKSYKNEWEYVIYFNMLWYFVWIWNDLDEWLYEWHVRFDTTELMFYFKWIEEDSSIAEIQKSIDSFVWVSKHKWWITNKEEIWDNMNTAASKEFNAYERFITPKAVLNPPEKKIFSTIEVDSTSDRMFDSLEKFKTLSQINKTRWINYNTLKNGVGTRVIEVIDGYVLAEDIILEYKKNYWI